MSQPPHSASNKASAQPRFDRAFIEEHRLLDRYLEGKLPFKGAREFEQWCADHPEYLEEIHLAGRTRASLELLEAAGRPQDLSEPGTPWWRTPWVSIGLGVTALVCAIGFFALLGMNALMDGKLATARAQLARGTMMPPLSEQELRIAPDHVPGLDQASIMVRRENPVLYALRIDMSYAPQRRFRVSVDKRDQGRALVINNLSKDSNGDLRVSFNTSALAGGRYDIRIEALPLLGAPIADGWFTMTVR